ncbi:MAG: hypothetical protein ACK56I_33170, partial [bacterium]
MAGLARDLAGIVRGRRPMSEGGGLLATLEGLLLIALLAASVTGTVWLALQGGSAALLFRDVHVVCARTCAGLALAHLAGVALHLGDLLRGSAGDSPAVWSLDWKQQRRPQYLAHRHAEVDAARGNRLGEPTLIQRRNVAVDHCMRDRHAHPLLK